MAAWPNSILSSVKTHENTLGIYKTAPKGPSDSEKQLSGLMNLTSKHYLQNNIPNVQCAVSAHAVELFSAAGTERLVSVEEKLNAPKYRDR